ncbi:MULTISPECIES: carbohydrate ABC transporter permease [Streptomyces]|uniref:Carbohydrate ABC transporter permease n=3 Tax=Streptomyces TaxID=1883 RepID=A0AAP6EIM4_9ACTN|nr:MULTISPECIES: carbohydrate ABC transporter permease [Streptomyces]KFG05673.1 sugar ABC transporter permease [Streptomyces scabiei]KND42101.1 sugar ABC transporter permease [Streptomyces stelliscabiei]MDX3494501.1 carbohydrate ABC transporter permease [Streptomyces turgidiscabies]MDX3748371.1 carbohydrate ABC transporter permease [Streptomyces sp. AK08-02]MDX2767347.1 carbohydrate ABC transporter permease [Streptomyces europaeiscabiei]
MTPPSIPYIEQTSGRGAARAARRRRGRNDGAVRRPGKTTYVILTLVALISIFPLYYALLLASSTSAEVAQNPIPSPIPGGQLADNLTRVFESDIDLPRAVWNSVFVSVTTALAVVLVSTLAGFAFSKLRFKGRAGLLTFVVGTMAVPTQLGVVPLFIVMREMGLTGSLWAVIIPGIASAFGVFWMTQYLQSALPYELIEAARIDGASTFRIFRSIVLPAARPAAAMLGLFTFIGAWTQYFWPSIVLGTTNPTLPVALQLLQAGFFKDIPLIMTGVLVSVVPLLVLFAVLGRQLVAGVMQGAVKG